MTQIEYLRKYAEEMPTWLKEFRSGETRPLAEFLKSRIVYYPGSRFDWHPIKVFGGGHSAHCFIFADYGLPEAELKAALQAQWLEGYDVFDEVSFSEQELARACPHQWHLTGDELRDAAKRTWEFRKYNYSAPYALLVIFNRNSRYDEAHGPDRLAVLFLGADGIASYDAIFANGNAHEFFGMLLQDHGWGGNYDHFGPGGLLEQIMIRSKVFPRFVLAGADVIYEGYMKLEGLEYCDGCRELFVREGTSAKSDPKPGTSPKMSAEEFFDIKAK